MTVEDILSESNYKHFQDKEVTNQTHTSNENFDKIDKISKEDEEEDNIDEYDEERKIKKNNKKWTKIYNLLKCIVSLLFFYYKK